MKLCTSCEQQNPDDAQFCLRCGTSFAEVAPPPQSEAFQDERQLWRILIGPHKAIQFWLAEGWSWKPATEYYLETFKRFKTSAGHRFTVTWHWPAFLFDPFLWFLYRKMYMYAMIYALGPVVSAYITGDVTVGIVWRIMAGVSANYIYFWHLKDHLAKITSQQGLDHMARLRLMGENGGVQPYVIWLGLALTLLWMGIVIAIIEQGPPEGDPFPETESPPKFF